MAVIPSPGLILPISDRVDLVQGNPALSPTGIARIAMIAGVPSVSINGGAYASFGSAGSAPSGTVQPQVRYLPTDHLDFIMGDPPVSPKGCGRLAVTTAGVASVSIESAAYASLGVSGAASTGCQIFPGFLYSTDYVDIVQGNPAVSLPGTARIACFTGATTLSISINGAAYTTLGALAPPGAPVLWYDAQNIDGLSNSSLIDGQAVGTWKNLGSTATADVVQATGIQKPLFRLVASAGKINNKSGVQFDGINDVMESLALAIAQPNWVYLAIQLNNTPGTQVEFWSGPTNNNGIYSNTPNNFLEIFAGTSFVLSAVVPTIGQWTLLAAQFNGGTSLLRKDGTQIASGSTGGNPIGGVAIGAHSGAANPSACIVVEALVYNATNPGFATVEAYFASKYGAFPQ